MDYNISPRQDLYNRLFKFAQDVRFFVIKLPRTIAIIEDGKQLMRSSGSVGANYIEAWEAISTKDELHRLKICRKESKESKHWLDLLCVPDREEESEDERKRLAQESLELTKIFGAIVNNKEGTRINVIKVV